MIPPGWTRALTVRGAAAIVLCLVLVVVLVVLASGRRHRDDAARAKANATFAEGRAAAGKDAIGVVTGHQDQTTAIDDRVKGSEDAVRQAPADRRDDAALRELCQSPSARRRPECAVLGPRP